MIDKATSELYNRPAQDADLQRQSSEYMSVLLNAYTKQYELSTDEWSADPAMRAIPALIQGRLKLARETIVLDIGCGNGSDAFYFSQIYAHVIGIDIYKHREWPLLMKATGNLELECVDLLSFRSSKRFDLILDNGCFHHQHPTHYLPYLRTIGELLTPGGAIVVSTFKNPKIIDRIDDNGRIHKYFTDRQLGDLFTSANLVNSFSCDIYRIGKGDYYRLSVLQASS